MVFLADSFVFQPPPEVAFARRVLVKPDASPSLPYPTATSRETLAAIIAGLRRASDADIILLEAGQGERQAREVFRALGYDFPRVIALDVRDCVLVEVENPLPKAFALPNFWVPNVLLSCDYLITVAPLKVRGSRGSFSLDNLLSLLPQSKYGRDLPGGVILAQMGLDSVIADLYFTLPFDLGVIDARKKYLLGPSPQESHVEDFGKIFSGEPFEADLEAAQLAGVGAGYLQLIASAKASFAA